jgi:hypothetical protein
MSFFSNFSDKHRIKALVGLVTRHHVWHGISAVAGMGVLVLLLTASSAQAANITVANGEVAVAANGKCSLIEAINNANNTNNGRPHADCAAGNPNGADTINLPNNGNFVLTAPAVVAQRIGAIGLPWISSQVTINGNGSTIRAATRPRNSGSWPSAVGGICGSTTPPSAGAWWRFAASTTWLMAAEGYLPRGN